MPGRILRSCSRCSTATEPADLVRGRCERCRPYGNEGRSPTTRTRPSSSSERERIRAAVLRRDPLCTIRLDGCTGLSEVADHVVPAADGGLYELPNLRGACDHCNSVLGGRLSHRSREGESHGHQALPGTIGTRPVTATGTRLH